MDPMHGRGLPIRLAVLDAGGTTVDLASRVVAKLGRPSEDALVFRDKASLFITCLQARPDLFFIDIDCLGDEGELARLAAQHPDAFLVATASRGGVSRMFAVLEAGAHEFLTPPFDTAQIAATIELRLAQRMRGTRRPASTSAGGDLHETRAELPALQAEPAFDAFVGNSARMKAVYAQIERISASNAPVFITGETGSGKEMCARAIHSRSNRAGQPFVVFDGSADADDQANCSLFGGPHGARGAFELADGGTLFLDEVSELELSTQSRLLQFLQTGEAGAAESNVRLICSTSRNPAEEIAQGRLREDLFYRLHVLTVKMPPLRERRDDILSLAAFFLRQASAQEGRAFTRLDAAAQECLVTYEWPGNVRQLENTIRQAVVMNEGSILRPTMLPALLGAGEGASSQLRGPVLHRTWSRQLPQPIPTVEPLWMQERRIIEDALNAFDGNISQAAAALEISPSTIYRKKQSWAERLVG
ncbi:sigma-54-dependent Fis family transcriptional regulator [Stappia sp. F7233]|uniref:Sigma-54-dependent Fis family transcriptional regulator n=1 Tax=Stappia albiluteola TaxID=2758565 RepID=A0A839AIQ9_9HYPH|nr:sigma-54 dependent transcriptional regulator [Stappia albiluteola]MBA5779015.1 sigma-54-dependent Fis family transcriptional regulator [Stappia albiluteola]